MGVPGVGEAIAASIFTGPVSVTRSILYQACLRRKDSQRITVCVGGDEKARIGTCVHRINVPRIQRLRHG